MYFEYTNYVYIFYSISISCMCNTSIVNGTITSVELVQNKNVHSFISISWF